VAITVFVEVLITDTEAESVFVTYTLLPSGLTHTPTGSDPTVMVDTTVFFAVLITLTVFPPVLAIYAKPPPTGVAVILATIGVEPLFTVINEPILPVPLADKPIPGESFTQL